MVARSARTALVGDTKHKKTRHRGCYKTKRVSFCSFWRKSASKLTVINNAKKKHVTPNHHVTGLYLDTTNPHIIVAKGATISPLQIGTTKSYGVPGAQKTVQCRNTAATTVRLILATITKCRAPIFFRAQGNTLFCETSPLRSESKSSRRCFIFSMSPFVSVVRMSSCFSRSWSALTLLRRRSLA